jgi:LmbE family N-acetylglucosaminyl deacetylase
VCRSLLSSLRSSARWPLAVALLATAALALGDPRPAEANPNCPQGAVLNIVAHQDDDLLFLSPDLIHDIQANRCVRTVFVTAGDAGRDATYWGGRENGAKAAYAQMAGVANTWSTADAGIAGRTIPVATLVGKPTVSLAFMRLPDGYPGGTGHPDTGWQSLQKLWLDNVSMTSLGSGWSTYTRAGLIDTLAALMSAYQPTEVNTQDHAGSFGDGDHSDHHATAYFAQAAEQAYAGSPAFVGYHDYKIKDLDPNLAPADITAKQNAFFTYGAYDDGACSSLPCDNYDYPKFLERQYKVLGPNLARTATATANNQDAGSGQTADKAIDGVIAGWPEDHTREWATVSGGAGSTLTLTWSSPQQIQRILIYDRPNPSDQITSAEVLLSDGTLEKRSQMFDGKNVEIITFASPKTVTSIEFKVSDVSVSTVNIGLAEIEVFNSDHALP